MTNKFKFLILAAIAATVFSCKSDEPVPAPVEPAMSYIINYGDYMGAKSTITAYNKETETVTNDYYENVNGVSLVSNVQHAFSYDGRIYMLGNNPDELLWVNAETFSQTENSVSADIVKPRFGVGDGNYLYISCWGGDIWTDESLSYIAKYNIASKTVEEKIALPGGPEGMAIANNKLYAALNYKDSVAVIDLISNQISYIETPAVTSYFLKDKQNNLYVSLVSTFSDSSESTGLGYINTANDALEATYPLAGVSTSYVNIMAADNDFSKIYVVTEGANWGDPGALAVFDVASKEFAADKFLASVPGINGIACYNNKVFVFIAESVTADGTAKTYLPDGSLSEEFATGKAPYILITAE